jgi:hypothetical protein
MQRVTMEKKRSGKKQTTPVALRDPSMASVDPNDVARLAHSYWEERNRQEGSAEEDWFRAERALRQRTLAAGAN